MNKIKQLSNVTTINQFIVASSSSSSDESNAPLTENTSPVPTVYDDPEKTHPFYLNMIACQEPGCKQANCLSLRPTTSFVKMPEISHVICSGAFKTLEKAQQQYNKMQGWKHITVASFKRQMMLKCNAGQIFRSNLGEFFYTISAQTTEYAYVADLQQRRYNRKGKSVAKDSNANPPTFSSAKRLFHPDTETAEPKAKKSCK